ncbi:PKD domain-containing protein [Halomontanus rarus]|uniref:PKD domain-containing protein n=1 Tax=Halomontanus rarus TaxID=3034020 RepID=UPI001A9941C1
MTRHSHDTDSAVDRSHGAETDGREAGGNGSRTERLRDNSRRDFLRASVAAGASALALGGSGIAAGQSVVEETCESFGEIPVGDEFLLINNDWGTQDQGADIDMCASLYDDGSYGYEWETRTAGGDPNYPQSLIGTKPWGDDSGSSLFPLRRGDVDELELELDVDLNISGGEWNLAEEWWLTSERPGSNVEGSITHEVMLVLEWGPQHDHGAPIDANATTDAYGNVIDYWANYQIGWDFHIFRIAANQTPSKVDLTAVMDYMTERIGGVSGDLWVSGIEVGNEYWEGVSGETTFDRFDVTVNGQTATSGSGSGGGGNGGSDGDGSDSDGSDGDPSDGNDDSGGDDGSNEDDSSADPNAELDPSTTSASVGERITFRVTDTTGNDTWIDSLEWDFDDGTTASGWWNAHTYESAGTYTVALMGTDNEGMTTTHEVTITVS